MIKTLFFDLETAEDLKILDIGAVLNDEKYHGKSVDQLAKMVKDADYICGHNIVFHDIPVLKKTRYWEIMQPFPAQIDTLMLSPLFFPERPYHKLIKDYKLVSEEINNPLSDSELSKTVLLDEIAAFKTLDEEFQFILYCLLHDIKGYQGFFEHLKYNPEIIKHNVLEQIIKNRFINKICTSKPLSSFIEYNSVPLAYFLALLNTKGHDSCLPQWVIRKYPEVFDLSNKLSGELCNDAVCHYCRDIFDPVKSLKRFFGYESFRNFNIEDIIPLQEQVVQASLKDESFITVFPTGGGKSLTFQLPALMRGEGCSHLTVIISPLQSLMKDQIDVLTNRYDIISAVTLNGLQTPIERSAALERLEDGRAHLLYISPESLRSRTIKNLLLKRTISRFVIDEAHCFSIWGQDFRVDYAFIGKFIYTIQEEKRLTRPIPVSCFTATAKKQVIDDIKFYFNNTLGLKLNVYKTKISRPNLHYRIIQIKDDKQKFQELLRLLDETNGAIIIYVTKVKSCNKLANKLIQDGYNALPYNGKMDRDQKIDHQNKFMNGEVKIIVATTAFGMGVDKDDVQKVIHYEISSSLEGYVQEAGRAGRRLGLEADCIILFNENDLNIHFQLLQLGKLNHNEINQIWRSIKFLSASGNKISKSAMEIAKKAGWQVEMNYLETKVKASISALENCGYLNRGLNNPQVFADSFQIRNLVAAKEKILAYAGLDRKDLQYLDLIMQVMVKKSKKEQQIDYLADLIGINLKETKRYINILREVGVLGDQKDLTIAINHSSRSMGAKQKLTRIIFLEKQILEIFTDKIITLKLKELNEELSKELNVSTVINEIKLILRSWKDEGFIVYQISHKQAVYRIENIQTSKILKTIIYNRHDLMSSVVDYLLTASKISINIDSNNNKRIDFSILELQNQLAQGLFGKNLNLNKLIDSLLFLGETNTIELVEGFFVYYPALTIERLENNNYKRYTHDDYSDLEKYYQNRIEQIHIVGEYAKKMSKNYFAALNFVDDYFTLDYGIFIKKHFPKRKTEIERPLTLAKFQHLISDLSAEQMKVISDNKSDSIMITAGPGSGKTRVLVHKIASLILMEDIKPEQFLMFAFSRIAAMELKRRLKKFLGNLSYSLDIFTFHGFCFDLLGRTGDLHKSETIIQTTIDEIKNNNLSDERITSKSVLLIDEFQDVGPQEAELIDLIIDRAETIRTIVVGDDDQNIYEFRGANVKIFRLFMDKYNAKQINFLTNYRSTRNIVEFSNQFIQQLRNRLKTIPLVANRSENGLIAISEYNHNNIFQPIVDQIVKEKPKGSSAVLTHTNEEAALLQCLLERKGIKSRLIISDNHFNVADILEIRTFTYYLESRKDKAFGVIDEISWNQCTENIKSMYRNSSNLQLCLDQIDLFNKIYKNKTVSEWISFISEINVEDTYVPQKDTILVTTMHKSKGKEFNNVYIMLRNYNSLTDAGKRVLYVAITRVKDSLSIHSNSSHSLKFKGIPNCSYSYIDKNFDVPDEILIQLGHRDVYLSRFKHNNKQTIIKKIISGEQLFTGPIGDILYSNSGREILTFSTKFYSDIQAKWLNKGYNILTAQAQFILLWKDKEEDKEYRIVLPSLRLKKELSQKQN